MSGPINLGDLVPAGTPADKIALIDLLDPARPREYSFGDLERMIRGVARLVTAQNYPRGSRVGIMGFNRAEYVAAYFGIMRAGLVAATAA